MPNNNLKEKNSDTLASVIKEKRIELNWTQRELSRRTGVDNNTIAKIEKGERKKPNVVSIIKIAGALDISGTHLLKLAGYTKEEINIVNSSLKNILVQTTEELPPIFPITTFGEIVEKEDEKTLACLLVLELLNDVDLYKKLDVYQASPKNIRKKFDNGIKYLKKDLNNRIDIGMIMDRVFDKNDK